MPKRWVIPFSRNKFIQSTDPSGSNSSSDSTNKPKLAAISKRGFTSKISRVFMTLFFGYGLKGILFILSIWGIARFCHHQTKGFRISKLEKNTTCLNSQHSSCLPPDLQILLQQKFHYFARGLESFSFLSEDGTTVLKLFNNRYQRRIFWFQKIPPIGFLKTWRESKISYNKKKWIRTFESYDLAYHLLKEETGLLFFHPCKSEDCPDIFLIDPLNIAHSFSLSKHAFVLQKKANQAYPYLESCIKKGELVQAKEAIFSLVSLIKKKMNKGIADRDPLIRTNIGFLDGKAMQLDLGPFSLDPSLKDPEKQKEQIPKILLSLKHWIETHHPILLPYFNEATQSL